MGDLYAYLRPCYYKYDFRQAIIASCDRIESETLIDLAYSMQYKLLSVF